MSHTVISTINEPPEVIDQWLGPQACIIKRESVTINRFAQLDLLSVRAFAPLMPDDQGRIAVYPIDVQAFYVQLIYQESSPSSDLLTLYWLRLSPAFFHMLDPEILSAHIPFRLDQTAELQFTVCNNSRTLIRQILTAKGVTPLTQALQRTEWIIELFRKALEALVLSFATCQVPACRFLAIDSEREKIFKARKILEETIDNPLTIRELSRKVAMNECYLKKGFKALVGQTIHECQQELRIAKAKQLLQGGGKTVTEVAAHLGYSSISHFSSAFKRATGLKPCELLA